MENPLLSALAMIGIPLVNSLAETLYGWRKIKGTPIAPAPASAPPADMPPFERRGPIVILAAATAVGLVAGVWLGNIAGFTWPPTKAQEWLMWIIIAAGVVGILEAMMRPYWLVQWTLRAAVVAAAVVLPIPAHIRAGWSGVEQCAWLGGFILAGLVTWWGFDRASRTTGPVGALLVVTVGTLASISFALTGHIAPAVVAGGLCAAIGPGAIVGFWRPRFSVGPAVAAPAVVLSAYFIQTSAVLGDTPVWCGALLALSAAAAGVASIGRLGAMTGLKGAVARIALTALPGLVSVGIGVVLSMKAGDGAGASGY